MNYLASLVLHQAERDPGKIRFQIIGQHGCDGPEYFIRVLNGASGDLLQDPGIVWLDPEDVSVFWGHATLERKVNPIIEEGLYVGFLDEEQKKGSGTPPAHPPR